MGFPAIQALSIDDVRDAVRASLRHGLDITLLADFVASIDWAGHESAPPEVKDTLAAIELWLTEFDEGDISLDALSANLLRCLPRGERVRLTA